MDFAEDLPGDLMLFPDTAAALRRKAPKKQLGYTKKRGKCPFILFLLYQLLLFFFFAISTAAFLLFLLYTVAH